MKLIDPERLDNSTKVLHSINKGFAAILDKYSSGKNHLLSAEDFYRSFLLIILPAQCYGLTPKILNDPYSNIDMYLNFFNEMLTVVKKIKVRQLYREHKITLTTFYKILLLKRSLKIFIRLAIADKHDVTE